VYYKNTIANINAAILAAILFFFAIYEEATIRDLWMRNGVENEAENIILALLSHSHI